MRENLYKYPRTPHLPFSEGMTSDDKVLTNTNHFENKIIVVTEKMDGENTTIYKDYYHARSLDSKHKEYHSWLINFMNTFQYLIPQDYHICGEYLYATHSIFYNNLKTYFEVFSIWDKNKCLSWKETKEFCKKYNLELVPELYIGIYDEKLIKKLANDVVSKGGEGIVIRLYDTFLYEDFQNSIAKFVRKNHVQTDKHWSLQQISKNELKK